MTEPLSRKPTAAQDAPTSGAAAGAGAVNAGSSGAEQPPGDSENSVRRELALQISDFLLEKKAEDVVLLDLEDVNPYFSIFVIATANSQVHLKSLIRDVNKRFFEHFPKSARMRTDDAASGWVILDLVDIVVHLFMEEQRGFYNLERLWGDARILRDSRRES